MPSLSQPLQFLLVALAGWMNQQQRDAIDYLQEENRVLRNSSAPSNYASRTISLVGLRRKPGHSDDACAWRVAIRERFLGARDLGRIHAVRDLAV